MEPDLFLLSIYESKPYQVLEYKLRAIQENMGWFLINLQITPQFLKQFLNPCCGFIISRLCTQRVELTKLYDYLKQDYTWTTFAFENDPDFSQVRISDEFIQDQRLFEDPNNPLYKLSILIIAYVYDKLSVDNRIDLRNVVKNEKFMYPTNQYHLTCVNKAVFKRDGLIFDHKGYYYNPMLDKSPLDQYDDVIGFAKIIREEAGQCDILYRLDEQLSIPEKLYQEYWGVRYEKIHGPQFHFNGTTLSRLKTITVHRDPSTMNKLLMVIKKVDNEKPPHWNVEIETLPVPHEGNTITVFLHGMYLPDDDIFTHIDLARNQYDFETYQQKYNDTNGRIKIDQYTEDPKLHYKIWCIENGRFSRYVWYRLMAISLGKYQELLDEILA